jgi:hypothetical protein
MSISQRQN